MSTTSIPVHRAPPRLGVLLVNLGTPDAPEPGAIRRYLREFLSDPRVVETPRAIWLPILYGFILTLRPFKLAHAYRSVWTEQGSPLLVHGLAQAAALQTRLGDKVVVRLAMRYGNPSVATAFADFDALNVRRLLVLPLYPQYSATTTASVFDAVYDALRSRRWPPELRTLDCYHDDPAYIGALAASVRRHWAEHGRGEHLLLSFHSIPLRYFELGDPYYCHCQKTARLLAEALELKDGEWSVSFQSRVGRARWLAPYTDVHIEALAGRGLRQLDVICPGFSADCLETLEEVALRYGETFRKAGGAALRYIPALNADTAHIDALAGLVQRHTDGWRPAVPSAETLQLRDARAAALQTSLREG
jgi:protoporphyrin/coproporphyrin ferrochelatase